MVELTSPAEIAIGRRGLISFSAGVYAYVGSALGPGGLTKRLARYTRGPENQHWHIDYLLAHGEILGTLTRDGSHRRECDWAQWVGTRTTDCIPGFGSSDGKVRSLLFLVGTHREMEKFLPFASRELKATPSIGV